jgi:hypothetical protein
MQNFKERYTNIENNKKLDFLEQLLQKDNNLQKQFFEFAKNRNIDEIIKVDIEDIRTRIYNELMEIDIEDMFDESRFSSDSRYTDLDGSVLIEEVITPYYNEIIKYIEEGNSSDAFRQILSIYELSIINIADLSNGECIFGDGLEYAVSDFVVDYPHKFTMELRKVVLSNENKELLQKLFSKRYKLLNNKYDLEHFQSLFTHLTKE